VMGEVTAPGHLSVLAVDDEAPALDELVFLLHADPRVCTVDVARDATAALLRLRHHTYDVLLLDVRMPQLDGLELARILLQFAQPPAVVFVTAYDAHALEAFEVRASDYLLKPPSAERLGEALDRVCARISQPLRSAPGHLDRIPVDAGGVTRLITSSDVAWVEAQGDYVRLHLIDASSYLVRLPISTLAAQWAEFGFVHIHRGFLVAIGSITELRTEAGGMTVRVGPTALPVARRHTRELRDRLVRAARPGGMR
jgi:DNA-binding LytR/AlgR family response regulator